MCEELGISARQLRRWRDAVRKHGSAAAFTGHDKSRDDEVTRLIAAAGDLKHQTALSLAYGTDRRASEVVALRVGDIDS